MRLGHWTSVLGAALLLTSCNRGLPPPVEKTWLTMGTFASVTLRGDDAKHLAPYCAETARCFDDLNQRLSVYLPDSELSHLNSATGMVDVSRQTFDMLRETARYAALTEGAFDPTVSPLITMWGFSGGKTPTNLPTAAIIAATLNETGYQHLQLTPTAPSAPPVLRAGFERTGMSLDLGGIAKGFAVDRAYDHLISTRPANTLINLGGNIRCHGMATPERPWRIGVRHPFDTTMTLGALTMESGMSVATSGNYERFVTIDGERYAHIIDPRTGYPVKGMAGVTVLSASATEADALSTALFVVGIEGAPALLEKFPTTHALLVPDRTPIEIWVSPGFQRVFTPHPEYAASVHSLPMGILDKR
jgi:FAD:protein FMN transferase